MGRTSKMLEKATKDGIADLVKELQGKEKATKKSTEATVEDTRVTNDNIKATEHLIRIVRQLVESQNQIEGSLDSINKLRGLGEVKLKTVAKATKDLISQEKLQVEASKKIAKSTREQMEAIDLKKYKEEIRHLKMRRDAHIKDLEVDKKIEEANKKKEESLVKLIEKEQKRIELEKERFNEVMRIADAENKLRDRKSADAEQKKRTAEIKKNTDALKRNRNKLKLLQDTAHSYGLELKKVAGGSKLLKQALKGDKVAFQQLSREIKQASKNTEKFKEHTRNTHGTISVLRSKLLLFSFAVGGSVRFIQQFIDASSQQEIAVKRVSNVIEQQGYASGVTTEQMKNLASSLQDTTGVSDEVILSSTALLLSFKNIAGSAIPTAQKTIIDMTSALNNGTITAETLKTQTIALGKALDNPIKGMNSLRRAGTDFDDSTKKHIKTLVKQGKLLEAQEVLLQAVNLQYGDSASIDSYELSQRAVESAMGDLSELVGDLFTPAMKRANDLMTKFAKSINSKDIANTASAIGLVSLAFVVLNKRMRTAIFTSTILTGGLSILIRATVGLASVFAVKKILDYTEAWSSLNDETKTAVERIKAIKEEYGTFTIQQLEGQNKFKNLILDGINLQLQSIIMEKEASDVYKKSAGNTGQILQNLLNTDQRYIRLMAEKYALQKDLGILGEVISSKEIKNAVQLDEDMEKQLLNLKTEKRILQENNELARLIMASKIKNGKVAIEVGEVTQKAIEIEIESVFKLRKAIQEKNKAENSPSKPQKDKFAEISKSLKGEVLAIDLLAKATTDLDKRKIELGLTDAQLILSGIDLSKVTEEQKATLDLYIASILEAEEAINSLNLEKARDAEILDLERQNHLIRLGFLAELTQASINYYDQKRAMQLQLDLDTIAQERELINQTVTNEKVKARQLEALNTKEDNTKKKAHNLGINLQMGQLLASTAMSVAQIIQKFQIAEATALAMFPIAGDVIVGKLEAQKNWSLGTTIATSAIGMAGLQAQKYEHGGIVGGRRHSAGGTMIEAEQGEYIMSRRAVKNFGIGNMNAINNGSAPVNITFNNPIMNEEYTEDIIIPQIKRAVQRGADIGVS